MSAAALAERLRERAVTVPYAGFVPSVSEPKRAQKKTTRSEGEMPFVPSVPSVPSFFDGVEQQSEKSRPDQAANEPEPAHGAPVLADWRQADAEYLRHHWTCPSCCAAGHGRGQRCTMGAELWYRYEAASSAAQPSNTLSRRIGK